MMDGAWLAEEFLKALGGRALTHDLAARISRAHQLHTGFSMAELRGFAMELSGPRSGARALPAEQVSRIVELNRELGEVEGDTEFEFDLILYDIRERL